MRTADTSWGLAAATIGGSPTLRTTLPVAAPTDRTLACAGIRVKDLVGGTRYGRTHALAGIVIDDLGRGAAYGALALAGDGIGRIGRVTAYWTLASSALAGLRPRASVAAKTAVT